MKRFAIKVLAFTALQAGLFTVLLLAYDESREPNYLAAACEKHARLERASPPRIILVGGSNLAFGIDSRRIEDALGRDVVNMGLAAGLGLDFMLNEIEPELKPGDIVVLSLEYDRFSGGYNPINLRQIIEYHPRSIRYLEPRQWNRVLIRGGLPIIGGIGRRALRLHPSASAESGESSAYSRNGFNRWGDLTKHHGMASLFSASSFDEEEVFHSDWLPTDQVIARLRRFAMNCRKRGIAFVYSCPPHPAGISRSEQRTVSAILQKLRTIAHLDILDAPEDHVYPERQFFDTGYHLTEEGKAPRTERLIRSLKLLEDSPIRKR